MARVNFRRKRTIYRDNVVDWQANLEAGLIGWSSADNAFKYTDALGSDTYLVPSPTGNAVSAIKTISKTIGGVGVADCDFNFATAANTTEQPIDLGAIIPAKARVIDMFLFTDAVFTGATTLVADVGNATGGAQYIASATIYAADAILPIAAAAAHKIVPNKAATHVWVNAIPGSNWSNVTVGKLTVYITYIDVTGA